MALKPKRKEKPGAVLAIALGAPKRDASMGMEPPARRAGGMGMGDSMMAEEPSPMEGAEDFEDFASTAFPDLQADPVRLDAFRKAVMAAMKPRGGGMGMRGR